MKKKAGLGFQKPNFFKKINCNEHVPTGAAVLHASSQLGLRAGPPFLFWLGFDLGGGGVGGFFFFFFPSSPNATSLMLAPVVLGECQPGPSRVTVDWNLSKFSVSKCGFFLFSFFFNVLDGI